MISVQIMYSENFVHIEQDIRLKLQNMIYKSDYETVAASIRLRCHLLQYTEF